MKDVNNHKIELIPELCCKQHIKDNSANKRNSKPQNFKIGNREKTIAEINGQQKIFLRQRKQCWFYYIENIGWDRSGQECLNFFD